MGWNHKLAALCGAVVVLPAVSAHIALWHPSMYGWDPNDVNQYLPVYPLADMTFDQWWFHGYINQPPADGVYMNLPSGGTYHGEVACNKALTSYGVVASQQTGLYACDGTGPTGGIGAMHTNDIWQSPNPTNVKGCGIAIAYKSDVTQIQPEDFTVITVNYTCPWFKDVDFQIPSDLPPCPPGGCHCMWGWVHSIEAGSEQMYFNGFRCNVTGATGQIPIPQAIPANKCPVDKSNCTIGPKQPHYWLQAERNNNFQGYYDPPFYNGDYGFANGAQTDLFANVTTPIPSSSPSSAPATPTSATPVIAAQQTTSALSSVASQVPTSATSTEDAAAVTTAASVSAKPVGKCMRKRRIDSRGLVSRRKRRGE